MNMMMTTPNEFLQFAKEMGLGKIKSRSSSSSSSSSSRSIRNRKNYPTTGLSALNNLCHLIEQIHQLKAENDRLRAHLELVDHFEKFQQRFILKDKYENKKDKYKQIISSTVFHDEEKSDTLSPSNSLKIKHSKLFRESKGITLSHNQEDCSSMLQIDHDQSELTDHSSLSSKPTWNKVRHALKFSLRRKQASPNSPPLSHIDRQIPTISVSIESDDDHLHENKRHKKKKKTITTNNNNNNNPQTIIGEDTDQDDESTQFAREYHKRRLDDNDTPNSSSPDRVESSTTNFSFNTSNIEDEALLTRKQSKIARYRRKLRSKLDTVKKQFSDQNTLSSARHLHGSHGSTFDDIGSGLNHALLTAQLAPALTKSYQQKMREWETMQRSHFLVTYRRQSVTPKIDLNSNSRKTSVVPITNETSINPTISSTKNDNCSSTIIDKTNLNLETDLTILDPILSPNQRSLIVHQWREIMSEEIFLRYYNKYFQKQIILLKELETNLKTLKTSIFCTNNSIHQQSMINIHENNQYKQSYLPQRCRSLQSLVSMPTSWILAVQSAAYSDILDGTSNRTTERAILFNRNFFDQLENFKRDRQKFEQDSIKTSQLVNHSKTNRRSTRKEDHTKQSHAKRIHTRGSLRKLSLISFTEFPQYFLPDPIIPLQTSIAQVQPSSDIEVLPTKIINEIDSNKNFSLSSNNFNKRSKRSRFDLKKTFQRSKSMCIAQFNSWLQGRRQQNLSRERRKSITESKTQTTSITPKLFSSPRFIRLHQRIFKQQIQQSPQINHTQMPVQILDDSDNQSQLELPVRIYFPPLTAPVSRHVRITDINISTSNDNHQNIKIEQTTNLTTPITNRKYSSSTSLKMATAKERRESFATLSNILNNKYL